MTVPDITGALHGVRRVDLSSVVMGPGAAQIPGDLGADLIKVEPVTGDPTRQILPQRSPGTSALSMNVDRDERSLLDLKNRHGVELPLELVATAGHPGHEHALPRAGAPRAGLRRARRPDAQGRRHALLRAVRRHPPRPGEHNAELLAEPGHPDEEIEKPAAGGVVAATRLADPPG